MSYECHVVWVVYCVSYVCDVVCMRSMLRCVDCDVRVECGSAMLECGVRVRCGVWCGPAMREEVCQCSVGMQCLSACASALKVCIVIAGM